MGALNNALKDERVNIRRQKQKNRKNRRRNQAGFTILELLVLLFIIGIITAIVSAPLTAWQSRTRTEGFIADFMSNIASARAGTLSKGLTRRLIIDDDHTFRMQELSAGNVWVSLQTSTTLKPALDLSGNGVARCLVFNTRGVMQAYSDTNCSVATTNTQYGVVNGTSQQLTITALGLVNRT